MVGRESLSSRHGYFSERPRTINKIQWNSTNKRSNGRVTVCSKGWYGWSIGFRGWFRWKVWAGGLNGNDVKSNNDDGFSTRDEVSNVRTVANNRFSRVDWKRKKKGEKKKFGICSQPFPRGKRMTKLYLSAFFASRSLSTCFFRDVAKFGKPPNGHPGRWILDNDAIENARIAKYRLCF